MAKDDVSRRKFFRRASGATTALGLTGCSQPPAPVARTAGDACGSHWEAPPKQKGNNLCLHIEPVKPRTDKAATPAASATASPAKQ